MRQSKIVRETNETKIVVSLNLDQNTPVEINTPLAFFTHMLEQLAKHSGFSLVVNATGDDDHHSVEDIGIALGQAFYACLGDKKGIERYASITMPMDESLMNLAIDISGRPFLNYKVSYPTDITSGFETELVKEFFQGFVMNANINLHIRCLEIGNTHHMIENIFKATAYVLKKAVAVTGETLPTTKGVIA